MDTPPFGSSSTSSNSGVFIFDPATPSRSSERRPKSTLSGLFHQNSSDRESTRPSSRRSNESSNVSLSPARQNDASQTTTLAQSMFRLDPRSQTSGTSSQNATSWEPSRFEHTDFTFALSPRNVPLPPSVSSRTPSELSRSTAAPRNVALPASVSSRTPSELSRSAAAPFRALNEIHPNSMRQSSSSASARTSSPTSVSGGITISELFNPAPRNAASGSAPSIRSSISHISVVDGIAQMNINGGYNSSSNRTTHPTLPRGSPHGDDFHRPQTDYRYPIEQETLQENQSYFNAEFQTKLRNGTEVAQIIAELLRESGIVNEGLNNV
ncbi:hypothetical protein DIZ76_011745 [Coccidioides immitis]|nr:hypothetical protein DIZ76_011745 [Coccidioides immitis]